MYIIQGISSRMLKSIIFVFSSVNRGARMDIVDQFF